MSKPRSEVPLDDRWNVEALYPDLESWQKQFDQVARESKHPHWPEIEMFRGSLDKGPEKLRQALELILSLDRTLSKLYTYAHLRHDEDITQDTFKAAFSRISAIIYDFRQEVSWFDPEILALSDETLKNYLSSPVLASYKFHLEKIIRMKPHTLSSDGEELLALAGKALQTSHKTFSALSDADFKFGKVFDQKGIEKELTHGLFGVYIRSEDRVLRKNAFQHYHLKYKSYENTLAELISGQVNKNIFQSRAKKYNSSLEASLFIHQIPTSVYHALITAVNQRLPSLHRYLDLRRRMLNLEELHLYDVYVPLTPQLDIRMNYADAEELIIKSSLPLGEDYQRMLKKGLKEQRWVDRYENLNKRSGAYSSGCFDSMPYILMNYKNVMRDVFTLAHEAGHSMHSLLSRMTQPYHDADYPIFVAEVASTFNEELLMQEMLKLYPGKKEQMFLINQKIEDIRTTLFRQTMFAEFELRIHQLAEEGVPLTPKTLKDEYRALNAKYFGPQVVIDEEIDIEWARIPHFYYNFYVYQYATGISAALALTNKVIEGGSPAQQAYLSFLKGGGSHYPLDLLRMAGVDMSTSEPVSSAIDKFDALVTSLEELYQSINQTTQVEVNR